MDTRPEGERAVTADGGLRLEHVSRNFGDVRAVDDLSLDIPHGSFVTLLGPSGCGKSTTLNIIAGLDRPDAGSVHLGGRDITSVPPNERRMAMVFQNYALYPHMTAFGNIGFSLKLQHRSRDEIARRVQAVAALLDIGHLLRRKAGELSGGQQQRVALGRALVKEPVVFLLDEPFSNLDAALRSRMRTEVKHLHLELATTSVLVTHDQEEAMTVSDLIAVMNDGKLVQYGTPHEIYQSPCNIYVATFVGKPRMSLLEGKLDHLDGRVEFVGADLRIDLGRGDDLGLAVGEHGRVGLGVRAEDTRVFVGGDAPPAALPATVRLLEPVGSDTYVELAVGSSTLIARVHPSLPLSLGQTVRLELATTGVHLFDLDSGERIVR